NSYEKIESKFKYVIGKLFKQHKYLVNFLINQKEADSQTNLQAFQAIMNKECDISELCDSLRFLSELLYQYYKNKVYILIDEYDAPIINSYKKEYFEKIISLVRAFLGNALKGNIYLQTGILT